MTGSHPFDDSPGFGQCHRRNVAGSPLHFQANMKLEILALIAALLWLGSTCQLAAAEEIKPPFKLHWGETTDRMERLLTGAKLRIVDRRNVDGREVWDVEGIVQEGLRRTVFSFKNGEL